MKWNRLAILCLAVALPAGTASANTISPTLVVVPGLGIIGIHVAFTLSILAAFIERPFVTEGGVRRFALCASLQANFVTTLVGLCCLPLACFSLMFPPVLLLWWPAAVWISYRVELAWYRRITTKVGAAPPRPGPIAWGNVTSNVVFFLILVVSSPDPSYEHLAWVRSLQPWLTILTSVGCAMVYLFAFLIPACSRTARGMVDAPPAPEPLPSANATSATV